MSRPSLTLQPFRSEPGTSAAAVAVTNLWSFKAPLATGRQSPGAGVVNEVIYVIGGYNGGLTLSSMEAYTPGTNSWAPKAPLPSPRGSPAGVGVINGNLYVAGGTTGTSGVTNTLYAYTVATNTWVERAPMNAPRGCGASAVIAGQLYVYSGDCNTTASTFQRYNPASNSWTVLPLPSFARRLAAGAAVGGKFYLVGGFLSTGFASSVLEVFDPATNTWTLKRQGRLNAMARRRGSQWPPLRGRWRPTGLHAGAHAGGL